MPVFDILSGAVVWVQYNYAELRHLSDLLPVSIFLCIGVALIVTYVAIKNAQSKKSADETKQK